MKNKTIITIAGRTAAGKSIIAKKLAERLGLTVLKSYTTRAPRPDEIANPADADHIFVSEAEYDKLTNIIAETCINGNRYCTTKEVLKNSDCYVIDPDGLSYLKKNLEPGFRLAQFYVYADEDIRKKRFMERGKSESEFRVRSDAENEQFSTYEDEHGYDIIIFNNGNIEDAVDIIESYVKLIIKDRLDEIEAKKNGTWVEPEPDDEEAAPDEEASNQEKKACSDSAAEVKMADSTDELQDDSVNLCSPSPDVDGVSDSQYTHSNLRTDGQQKVGCVLPSNDEKTEENASSDEGISLADSIIDIDAEESHETADEAATEPKDSDFDPFSLDEDDSTALGLEDEAEKPSAGTVENVNAEPKEDDSLTIDETSEELTEEAEQQNTDDCEEAEEDEDDEDEDTEAILIE